MKKRVHWVSATLSSNKEQVSMRFFSYAGVRSQGTTLGILELLLFSRRTRWTISFEALVSADHFCTPFLGRLGISSSCNGRLGLQTVIVAIELLEPSVAHLVREGFWAMNFLELVMNLNSRATEEMVVKENGTLVAMSAFYVWGCASQATPYICDLVPFAGDQVLQFHKNTDSTENGYCFKPLL